jgi:hypothetical protein
MRLFGRKHSAAQAAVGERLLEVSVSLANLALYAHQSCPGSSPKDGLLVAGPAFVAPELDTPSSLYLAVCSGVRRYVDALVACLAVGLSTYRFHDERSSIASSMADLLQQPRI